MRLAVSCLVAAVVFCLLGASCGYGRQVCQIIDTAQDACTVIRYLGPDGEEREVRVPRAELQRFAQKEAARQAAIKPERVVDRLLDAGADQ